MKALHFYLAVIITVNSFWVSAQSGSIAEFRTLLTTLAADADNSFMQMHFESMLSVINADSRFSAADSSYLEYAYNIFLNDNTFNSDPKEFSTYENRMRPMILAWVSPTDGEVSFSWLEPPTDWDPDAEYPLYIQLHGLWNEASNDIQYLTYPFRTSASTSESFADGYLLSPWGRGNIWYQGIGETDIWECIDALKAIVHIDPRRMYLSGHSMGGYGAWHIASRSVNTWAALGVHAGALGYSPSEVSEAVADELKDLPTYFVCGTNDGLLSINQTAYDLLIDAGNENVEFVTFVGGHEYVESNVFNMYSWMKDFENDDYIDVREVEDNSSKLGLTAFPNPFSEFITFHLTTNNQTVFQIEIYNLQGQVVEILSNMKEQDITWTPETLSHGIYICKVTDGIASNSLVITYGQ